MCGIAGFVGKASNEQGRNCVKMMLEAISHRGPDDQDVWLNKKGEVWFGHNRLSIIDLSVAGRQPMLSATGRYVITYNGEVYNFREIRAELVKLGSQFRSRTDTEVILEAFGVWGISAIEKFRGMFAFAVFDKEERRLHLVRDRVGIKPLYYGWINADFVFASDLAAIKAFPGFDGAISQQALMAYIRFGYIAAPQTIYSNIYKLLPGTYLSLSLDCLNVGDFSPYQDGNARYSPRHYWDPSEKIQQSANRQDQFSYVEGKGELKHMLQQSIREQLVSDVPLGCFLSGGIDSSLVAAIMREVSTGPVKTFSIGFDQDLYDEAPYGRKVAQYLGTDHTEMYVGKEEVLNVIAKMATIYSEPLGDPSQLPTSLLTQLTRQHATVALSGDGGDELFAGYERYIMARNIWQVSKKMPQLLKVFLDKLFAAVSPDYYHLLLRPFLSMVPEEFRSKLQGSFYQRGLKAGLSCTRESLYVNQISQQCNPEEIVILGESENLYPFDREIVALPSDVEFFQFIDFLTYLPEDVLSKVDRASMAASLEVRVPLLDHRIVEYAWSIPLLHKLHGNHSKVILQDILSDYMPRKLFDRPKQGFSAPIGKWLRSDLYSWGSDLLSEGRIKGQGFLKYAPIKKMWDQHKTGKVDWSNQLWTILMFQQWYENG